MGQRMESGRRRTDQPTYLEEIVQEARTLFATLQEMQAANEISADGYQALSMPLLRLINRVDLALHQSKPQKTSKIARATIEQLDVIRAFVHKQLRTDQTTHLLNQIGFYEQIDRVLNTNPSVPVDFVVGYADAAGLKDVNDAFGHAKGSTFIVKLGHILREHFRTEDFVMRVGTEEPDDGDQHARMNAGGDEFAILLRRCDREKATVISQRFSVLFSATDWDSISPGLSSYAGIDIGLACIRLYPWTRQHNGVRTITEAIVKEADALMYQAKETQKQKGVRGSSICIGSFEVKEGVLDLTGRTECLPILSR